MTIAMLLIIRTQILRLFQSRVLFRMSHEEDKATGHFRDFCVLSPSHRREHDISWHSRSMVEKVLFEQQRFYRPLYMLDMAFRAEENGRIPAKRRVGSRVNV